MGVDDMDVVAHSKIKVGINQDAESRERLVMHVDQDLLSWFAPDDSEIGPTVPFESSGPTLFVD